MVFSEVEEFFYPPGLSCTKDFYCVWRISTCLRDFKWIRVKNCMFCPKIVIEMAKIFFMKMAKSNVKSTWISRIAYFFLHVVKKDLKPRIKSIECINDY